MQKGRMVEFDVLRGVCLFLMIFRHFGISLTPYLFISVPFDFIATGLVFTSGLMVPLVYVKRLEDDGNWKVTSRSIITRFLKIITVQYCVVILILLIRNILFFDVGEAYFRPLTTITETNLLEILFLVFFLIMRPLLLDILPMFLFFSLLAPFTIIAIRKGLLFPVLFLSASIFLIFQLFPYFLTIPQVIALQYRPQVDPFPPLLWQIVFFGGVAFGHFYPRLKEKWAGSSNTMKKFALFGCVFIWLVLGSMGVLFHSIPEYYFLYEAFFAKFPLRTGRVAFEMSILGIFFILIYVVRERQTSKFAAGFFILAGTQPLLCYSLQVTIDYMLHYIAAGNPFVAQFALLFPIVSLGLTWLILFTREFYQKKPRKGIKNIQVLPDVYESPSPPPDQYQIHQQNLWN